MIPTLRLRQSATFECVCCQLLLWVWIAAGEGFLVPVKPFQEKCNWNGSNSANSSHFVKIKERRF